MTERISNELIMLGGLEEVATHRERAIEAIRAGFSRLHDAYKAGRRAAPTRQFQLSYELGRAIGYTLDDRRIADAIANEIQNLDRAIWDYLLERSKLGDVMDHTAKEEWRDRLKADPPEATLENMRATLLGLYARAGEILENGVVNLFERLLPRYKRHDAYRFTGKFILSGAIRSYGGWDYGHADQAIKDLERMLYIFDGKPPPSYVRSIHAHDEELAVSIIDKVSLQLRANTGGELEDERLLLRWFKKGTLHCYVLKPEHVERLNAILAKRGGIPDARTGDRI